ncbi:hypothetical protein [Methanosphaerula palustris]|uniref:Uncharacterized protein n=1 Tax=Methanosphaerula palustris (strain ATCC BAA-1556 / DSM 19958 / E1-9c) TaxID=521011 RepID=B8GGA3_METPE|nr:hypothetical protein [Methanosphaerula palustris]ACL16177.1 conserved hypothetical protein [Methanosphaerula palustris E1-9c]
MKVSMKEGFEKGGNLLLPGLLFSVSALLLGIVIIQGRGDLPSAVLVLAGVICFLTGILIITFLSKPGMDTEYVSYLGVDQIVSFSRILTDLGIQGNACILVPEATGGTISQWNPVSQYVPFEFYGDQTFITDREMNGVLTRPAGSTLFAYLQQRHGLHVPGDEKELFACITEVGEDLLEIAERVEAYRTGDNLTITLAGTSLYAGCACVQQESPRCCELAPCAICSLVLCICVTGLHQGVQIDRIRLKESDQQITIQLSILPEKEQKGGEL